jgi:hypothetical protein
MPILTPRRAVLAAVVAALGGTAYFAFRPAPRTAPAAPPPGAHLLVESRPGLLPGGEAVPPGEAESYRKALPGLVACDFVTNAALRDPKVAALEVVRGRPDAAAWLAGRLAADYGENSSVLRISVTGVPPKEAALLANAVAGAFLNEVVQKDLQTQLRRRGKLEDAQAELARALDARKQALNQLASAAGVPPNAADHRALIAALYQERAGLRAELARARAERDACPEPAAREKLLREELAALDARVKSCEQANLDAERAEVARLEAAVSSVASEQTRLRIDLNSPPRVTLLAPATVPGD